MALSETVVPQDGNGGISMNLWKHDDSKVDYGTYGTYGMGKMMNRFLLGYILFGQSHLEVSASSNAVVFLPKGRDRRCPVLFIANTIHLTCESQTEREDANPSGFMIFMWSPQFPMFPEHVFPLSCPTQARTVDKASNFSGKPTPTVTVSKRYKYACRQPRQSKQRQSRQWLPPNVFFPGQPGL